MKSSMWIGVCGLAIFAACAATPANAQPPPKMDAQGRLTAPGGMVLYTYDPDSDNVSRCSGPCAVAWPPYPADGTATPPAGFRIVVRSDRGLQWSYHGHPLYLYAGDFKPGVATGDGVNGVWHIARAH